jgi:hypothetical protein
VNSNRNATCASSKVIARQCALPALIQLTLRVEGKRVRGYNEAGTELITQKH